MLDNCYKVKKIIYKQHCRCFCPIGQRHYTNNFTVTISPEETIPDYCEIDQWIAKNLEGETLLIEDAARLLQQWLETELSCGVSVLDEVFDAGHGAVTVEV